MSPRATYRLQFHKDFTFAHAEALVPYFAALGISHVYASPITTARKGSLHGYDVTDPTRVNPELGGEEGLRSLSAALKNHGLGLIVDIVPNHMAASLENAWWADVLTHGRDSAYARSFDVDWGEDGKILLPWLTRPAAEAEAAGEPEKLGLPEPGAYRLAWWRTANDRINWRRFFDINDLVCLRMDDDGTFERVHSLVFRLLDEGLVSGVRVDHIDGLADPAAYCGKLRERIGDAYLVVEKILLAGETLPTGWHCDGTTGYDFMDQVSALQHDPEAAAALGAGWAALTGRPAAFSTEEEAARREMLARSFGAQLEACVDSFLQHTPVEELSRPALRRVLTELLVHFPVYRTYATPTERPPEDEAFLERAAAGARRTGLIGDRWIVELLQHWFRELSLPAEPLRRFQQLSAPIAAKSVEDTAFYRYGRLLSRNDVGFDPHRFGAAAADFHALMRQRATAMPRALLATATHDHKRGEDVRARLAVLSERPLDWISALQNWVPRCAPLAPDDLVMLLQTIVGAWPLDLELDDLAGRKNFADRLTGWQTKALREAKLRSDWAAPNDDYEGKAQTFLEALVAGNDHRSLLADIFAFIQEIAAAGAVNGLAQLILKLTVPGVPDLYQGTEYWDFSLVDPDNRRPVDFSMRRDSLDGVDEASVLASWRDGRVKQLVASRLLSLRRSKPALFARGDYTPIASPGHVVSFRRGHGRESLTVVVPRFPGRLMTGKGTLQITKDAAFSPVNSPELFGGLLPLSVFIGQVTG